MISLYGLFILLLTAGTIHAQGNTNDGDAVDLASGSKEATSLPLGTTPTTLPTTLQESNTPDQSDASASADSQPGNECKGGHGIRKISKSCPQQPSPPEPQSSTLYDPSQSDEMPLPVRAGESEVESYIEIRKADQYHESTKEEAEYFESEYLFEDILGKGRSGVVCLATRNSDGMKVAYKSIPRADVYEYALESTTPPICHLRNPLVSSKEQSVAQCMSSRPPNLLVPYEFMVQRYLSRPGQKNPYVPKVFDYIILEDEYILVMEHLDEKWVNLAKYAEEKGRLDIEDARDIVREIVNGVIYLKQYGIVHEDLNEENVMYNPETRKVKLIDFGITNVLSGWEEGKSLPLKSPDTSSKSPDYKAGIDELWHMARFAYWSTLTHSQLTTASYATSSYSAHPFAHLVVECEQVAGHRIQSGLVPAIQKSRLRLLGRALDPGVENVYTWLRGGVLNGEADLDQRRLDGTVEHESMGTMHDNRAAGSTVS
ncbi:hypothetical protein BASA61_007613 [Batrachochytrium salamandrivorans]|nr:hypothetical protein BASA60_007325 [Batrachochytrium salamandrivorans]KAH6584172.1 hypothetical protein BASA61_007613 [Batrachochytrium salamandrivorans]KAH9271131.1 hypothetical protein BASA83_006675 [Batrachochytrium salamandrivorans]